MKIKYNCENWYKIINFQNEIWKDIEGYENLYQISNYGRVKSIIRNKIKHYETNHNGYLRVNLCKKRKIEHKRVHRLVAEAFIPNPQNLPQINHKDGNKLNNCVNNLEWCTPTDNVRHSVEIGTFKKTCKKVDKCLKL